MNKVSEGIVHDLSSFWTVALREIVRIECASLVLSDSVAL
jgi:hypothetical protein